MSAAPEELRDWTKALGIRIVKLYRLGEHGEANRLNYQITKLPNYECLYDLRLQY
jgi:hypothetical protein